MLNHFDLFHRLILLFHQIFLSLVLQIFVYSYLYDHHLYWLKPLFFFVLISNSVYLLFLLVSIVCVCVCKAFPKGWYVNLACSIICLWLEGNISSPGRYLYLSIFLDDHADTFTASLLKSYCSFPSLISSSIVMIIFYILAKRFLLRHEGLSDARVASLTKKEYGYIFCKNSIFL